MCPDVRNRAVTSTEQVHDMYHYLFAMRHEVHRGLAQLAEVDLQGREVRTIISHMVQLNHHQAPICNSSSMGLWVCRQNISEHICGHCVIVTALQDLLKRVT